jgi:hypothetical protein
MGSEKDREEEGEREGHPLGERVAEGCGLHGMFAAPWRKRR